jgi:xanthine phosphoribosyltransferase
MKALNEKILKDGKVLKGDILMVDNFINHQIDTELMQKIAAKFVHKFNSANKVLTIEASGIAPAILVANLLGVPLVFAKKQDSLLLHKKPLKAKSYSYTKQSWYNAVVAREYINKNDKVVIIDDFLANGNAVEALAEICHQAGAQILGVGIIIEKSFQTGRKRLEEKNIEIYSLAKIKSFKNKKVELDIADDEI